MKHAQAPSKSMVTVSDAAMERARRALNKVAYSSAKTQQIAQAAQMLPDVAVMAGGGRKSAKPNAMLKLAASA